MTAPGGLSVGQPPDAEGVNDYVTTRGRTGGKADLPASDVAQDVITVPQKVIQDQADTSARQALENVAGVSNGGYTRLGQYDGFELIRGFAPGALLRNGYFDEGTGINTYLPWLGDASRVEVLKGAAALLYGPASTGGIGGIINIVTVQPLQQPAITLGAGTDTFGGWSTNIDASERLNSEGTWLARFVGEVNDQPTWVDHFRVQQKAGDLTVQGLITADTKLTLNVEWIHQENNQYYGYPAYGSLLPAPAASPFQHFSASFQSADPRDREYYDGGRLQAIVDHRFNADWNLRVSLAYNYGNRDARQYYISPTGSYATTGLWSQQYNHTTFQSQTYTEDTTLEGRFDTFGHENRLTVGVQAFADLLTVANRTGASTPTPSLSPILLWNTYNGPSHVFNHDHPDTNQIVVYANDLISLTDKLKLSAGLSFVDAWLYGTYQVPIGNPSYNATQSGVAARVGPIYQVVPNVFLFADYATAFVPATPSLQSNGTVYSLYSPLTGDQYEAGVKWEVPGRISLTAAVYQLTEYNVQTADPVDPNLQIQSGEQRSRGAELDGAYHFNDRWNLITALAYTDAHVTKDNTLVVGSALIDVPKYSGRIFPTYTFPLGEGSVTVGAGVTFASTRAADIPTAAAPVVGYLPGYARVDALATYTLRGWRAAVNVINVLDTRYQEAAQNLSRVYPGEPLGAFFHLSKTF